jgi:hypothetical protein
MMLLTGDPLARWWGPDYWGGHRHHRSPVGPGPGASRWAVCGSQFLRIVVGLQHLAIGAPAASSLT